MGGQATKTTDAIKQASNQGTDTRPADGCCDCNKIGLAILPVVPSPVPNSLRNLSPELQVLTSHYKGQDLKTHGHVLRALPSGYLYVLKPDLSWDGYVVDAEGLLRMMPPGAMPASPSDVKPMKESCRLNGDNIPAQVIAVDPTKYASIWLAFSRYRWTQNVLADYAANKEGCRDKRMTKVDAMAAAAGTLITAGSAQDKSGNAPHFAVPMGENVGQYVADYASAAVIDTLNTKLVTPLRARVNQAKRLAARMASISKETSKKTGVVVALRDDLGFTIDLNASRNAETAK